MSVSTDPITFQIIRHKLNQVIDEAIIALENVSGSPITNEGHDMMVSLYKADGGLMVGGVGFLHHLTSAVQAVKHVIAHFSDDPGINEDDVYFFNDSYSGALHPPDVYIISPIHWEGRLTGFVANFVHVTDIGAIDPGGFSPTARECYHEGFQTKGLKIVERGKMRRDVVETFLNMVRDPGMVFLDLKSQLAANHVAKERMHKLYRDYGVEAVTAVGDKLIRQSEQLLRQRLRELPDGTWHARQYVDMPERTYTVQVAATKQGDTLTYDFTGSSPQASTGINCCYWSTWGAMFAPIFPLLAWDMTWNEGLTQPVRLVAPEGTVVNCRRPAPISVATVGMVNMVNNLSTIVLSKMLAASDKYSRRATAVWHGSHSPIALHGLNHEGEYFTQLITDVFCGSGGGRAFRDGVDLGGEIPNVVSRWANVETHELHTPIVYLYRRVVPDSGGPGKYRGGMCHEWAFTPYGTGGHPVGMVMFGKGSQAPMSLGVAGGYPGCNVGYSTFRHANVSEHPHSLETTRGETRIDKQWGTDDLNPGDVQYMRLMGGGGYGDPVDRDPEAVARDVRLGLVSAKVAWEIYGVALDADTGTVDKDATAARRRVIRGKRLGRAPRADVSARHAVPASGMRISEYLQQSPDGDVQCTWCGHRLCAARLSWKEHAVRLRRPLAAAGPLRTGEGTFFLVEAACPDCGTLLDVDVVMGGDPEFHDRIVRWP